MNMDLKNLPKEIKSISEALKQGGFEVYAVGGCVRDMLLDKQPKDWDFATNATPEEIQKIFPDSFYENTYGTVGVKTDSEDTTLKVVEITPYRLEAEYDDKRHPNKVIFSDKLEDDLKRRDFTINALALDIDKGQIVDLYKGHKDIKDKLVRAVGEADDRFNEDALRMLRAIRFAAELRFVIEQKTAESIAKNANLLEHVSRERVGDEFKKIVMSDNPIIGFTLAEKLNILSHFSPVFLEAIGVDQNKEGHKYDVWEHSLRTLQHAADKDFSLEVRLAALFHDIGKAKTIAIIKGQTTFYNHEMVSEKVARETLKNMSFSNEIIEKTAKLVRYHMFFADTNQITHSAVRRLIAKVGKENIWDLINLRFCDRIGMGRPKEEPYRLRKYEAMIEEVIRDPISVSMLKIDGNTLIQKFHVQPGPKIGYILHILLEDVLEDPKKNDGKILENRVEELLSLKDNALKEFGTRSKAIQEEAEQEEIEKILKDRGVK